jgi:SecD/SecF fusion protein
MMIQRASRLTTLALALMVLTAGCRGRVPDINQDGGMVLVYDIVDPRWEPAYAEQRKALLLALRKRVDPMGKHGINTEIDDDVRVSVSVPGNDSATVERVKKQLAASGQLEMLIVANADDHERLIALAQRASKQIVRDGEDVVGKWVTMKLPDASGFILRDAASQEAIEFPSEFAMKADSGEKLAERWLAEQGIKDVEVLLAVDRNPDRNIQGKHFKSAEIDSDEQGRPCILFSMTKEGTYLLRRLSATNLPDSDTGKYRRLGIIFHDELISAPRIQSAIGERGRITGSFTKEEIYEMLNSIRFAAVPYSLSTAPVRETRIEPK